MSEANQTLDPIGYRCDGCGRLFQDPYADLSAIRAAGGMSCCPERKPVGLSARIEELEAKLAKAVEGFEKLARLGNGGRYGNSDGNVIAQRYLAELTGGKDE